MRAERVLVGIDAEAASQRAADWVIDRAQRHALAVTLVTAFDLLVSDPHADELRLAETAQRIRGRAPDATVEIALIDRSTVEGLVDLSASFDVLVLGAHPQRRVRSALTGSLPYRVASRSHCSTVVVPDGWTPTGGPVVVGIGDDATANRAMLFAARDAIEADRELEVVHAWQLPAATDTLVAAVPGSTELRRAHRELLSTAMERVRAAFPTVRVRGFLNEAAAGETLLTHAAGAALVVLGTHHRGAITGALLGSTGRVVLGQGEAPVCIVPPARPTGRSSEPVDPAPVGATGPGSGT